jgi:hypothetical protein
MTPRAPTFPPIYGPFRPFGKRAPIVGADTVVTENRVADELRLFALTFAGGFLFMTVFLA